MNRARYGLVLLFISLFYASCIDDDDGCPNLRLPSATTEGRNTYGCFVDEELWVPYEKLPSWPDPLFLPELRISYSKRYSSFGIIATRDLSFTCDSVTQLMNWVIAHDDSLNIKRLSLRYSFINAGRGIYRLDSTENVAFEVLKFDTLARIFSAKFDVTVSLEDKSDSKTISDGRLDIKY